MPRVPNPKSAGKKQPNRVDTTAYVEDESKRFGVYDKRLVGALVKLHQVAVMTGAPIHVVVLPPNKRRMPILYSSRGNILDDVQAVLSWMQCEPGVCAYNANSFASVVDRRRLDDKLNAKQQRVSKKVEETPVDLSILEQLTGDQEFQLDLSALPMQVPTRGSGRNTGLWPSLAAKSY